MEMLVIPIFLAVLQTFERSQAEVQPPVRCHGPVPIFSQGRYYYYDNGTYLLNFSKSVHLNIDLHSRSCFQVDVSDGKNSSSTDSDKVTSVFYSVRYMAYEQTYDVRSSYEFGIAELQSYCKCDCPLGENFCTYEFDRKICLKREICITKYYRSISCIKYYAMKNSEGCNNPGPATLCCEIVVRPYENRRFVAVTLSKPKTKIRIEIEMYAQYRGKWKIFERHHRTILPYKGTTLVLNGFRNVARLRVAASTVISIYFFPASGRWYFYEENEAEFRLFDSRRINALHERDPNKFGWLRFRNGQWVVRNPLLSLYDLHRPLVTNCREQKYTDFYHVDGVAVIRNSTSGINTKPYWGEDVGKKNEFLDYIRLIKSGYGRRRAKILVSFKPSGTPKLQLNLNLNQEINIVAQGHIGASFLKDFTASVFLDKYSKQYLKITLIRSYGEFQLQVFQDSGKEEPDLDLSLVTKFPFATNYTEILPLPGFIYSSRFVCVDTNEKPKKPLCKLAPFIEEPMSDFELGNPFLQTQGWCPGCNFEPRVRTNGQKFIGGLDPRNWLDGIDSVFEGLAMVVYLILVVVVIGVWRRCLYPLIRWAFFSRRRRYSVSRRDGD